MMPRDPSKVSNAILAGLVAITASCNNVDHWAAATIGLVGGLVYIISSKLMSKFNIDDPIQASQVHGFVGFWGVLAVGIFDRDTGLIYTGSHKQLQVQLIGAIALALWMVCFCLFFFKVMQSVKRLRVSAVYEIVGIDLLMHASLHDLSMDYFLKKNETQRNGSMESERSTGSQKSINVIPETDRLATSRSFASNALTARSATSQA